MFSADHFIFTIAGQGVSLVEFLSVLTGLACVFLAGRNRRSNFWFGYLYNVLLFLMFWSKALYSAMLLQPISLGMNILGHWRWSHPREGEESGGDRNRLKVSSLRWRERGFAGLAVVLCTLVWGFVLKNLGVRWGAGVFAPDPLPLLDAFLLMLTLTALYLSAQKKWECWVVWLLVNAFNIVLYLSSGLVFMPVVAGIYLMNAAWSLSHWRKLYKNGN